MYGLALALSLPVAMPANGAGEDRPSLIPYSIILPLPSSALLTIIRRRTKRVVAAVFDVMPTGRGVNVIARGLFGVALATLAGFILDRDAIKLRAGERLAIIVSRRAPWHRRHARHETLEVLVSSDHGSGQGASPRCC